MIYRLEEKFWVAEGQEFPRMGGGGGPEAFPPEMFWNEFALRCNLVHFETEFWEILEWYSILFFSVDHVLTMLQYSMFLLIHP